MTFRDLFLGNLFYLLYSDLPLHTSCSPHPSFITVQLMHANDSAYIKEVWSENLEEEMAHLRDLVEEYPYLAMVGCLSIFCPLLIVTMHTPNSPSLNTFSYSQPINTLVVFLSCRIRNSQVSSLGLLALFELPPITTTRPYAAMSTS